ncbi:MAG: hypothetical protein ACRENP_15815 [Longimicrobiales bacterium]
MYATCLFCNQSLGSNESIETFPVGRRLAFDAERGRLWVVCRKCERWNLSPIEERWEAIESCERLFHDTRTRISTEQVGLARLGDGLELVRIGRPLRPEFAAWRYGDQFGRRRRRTILLGGGVAVVIAGVIIGGAVTGVLGGGFLAQSGNLMNLVVNRRTRLRLRTDEGRVLKLKTPDIEALRIIPAGAPGGLIVSVGKGKRMEQFRGAEAERVANVVVPKLNIMGGNKAAVQDAVRQIEARGGSEAFVQSTIQTTHVRVHGRDTEHRIAKLPKSTRLALEMALHEERERRALEGELQILEEAWRQAEEIAAISDDLVLPPGTQEFIDRARKSGRE